MNVELMRNFFLWCTAINYAVLLLWFFIFCLAHDWLQRLHCRLFGLSTAGFDAMHYGGMAVYKIGILMLNLAPAIALCIMG